MARPRTALALAAAIAAGAARRMALAIAPTLLFCAAGHGWAQAPPAGTAPQSSPAQPAASAIQATPPAAGQETGQNGGQTGIADITGLQLRKDGGELNLEFILTAPVQAEVVSNLPRQVVVVKINGARATLPEGKTQFAFNDPLLVGLSFDAIDDTTTWALVRLRVPDVLVRLTQDPSGTRLLLGLRRSPVPVGVELNQVRFAPTKGGTRVQLDLNRLPQFEDEQKDLNYVIRLKNVTPRLRAAPREEDERLKLLGTEQQGPDTLLRFQLKRPGRVTSFALNNPPRLVFTFLPRESVAVVPGPGGAKEANAGAAPEDLGKLLESEPDLALRGNYLAAEKAFAGEDYPRAQQLFEAVARAAPTHKLGIRATFRAADAEFERLAEAKATNFTTTIINYQTAIRAAERAKYDSDQIPHGFFQIGRAYQLMGFNFESTTNFQILQDRFPNSPFAKDASFYLGRNYLALNQYPDAIRGFRQYFEAQGDPALGAAAHYNLGEALYNQRQFTEAKNEFDQARRLDPEYPNSRPVMLFHMGEAYYENAEFDIARQVYRQLLDRYPDQTYSKLVALRLGDLLRDEGKEQDALAVYEQVIKSAPLEILLRGKMRVAGVLANRPAGDDWRRSLTLYDEVIAQGGDRLIVQEAQLRKALVLTLHNQHREAIAAFETLRAKYPKGPYARDNLVKANIEENLKSETDRLYQRKQYWEIVKLYAQYKEDYFRNLPFTFARFEVGQANQQLGLNDAAIGLYNELEKENPGSLRSLIEYEHTVALADKDDLGGASAALQRLVAALEKGPYTIDARLKLGEVYLASRQYPDAEKTYRALIQDIEKTKSGPLVEAAPQAYYRLALINKELGQQSEALENFRQAVARYNYPLLAQEVPDFIIRSQFAVGDLLFDMGQNQQALAAYEQAIGRYSTHERAPWASYQMGLVYRRTGEDKKALEIFNSLVELAKTRPGELWEQLARENQRDLNDKLKYQSYLQQ